MNTDPRNGGMHGNRKEVMRNASASEIANSTAKRDEIRILNRTGDDMKLDIFGFM